MDDPDITMEEYIRLEVEKARRYGRNFNWETTTYGKVRCLDDINLFKDFEDSPFSAIVLRTFLVTEPESLGTLLLVPFMILDIKFDFNDVVTADASDIRIPSKDIPVNSLNDVTNNNTNPNELDKDVTAHSDTPTKSFNHDPPNKSLALKSTKELGAQRHPWLRYEVDGYTEEVVQEFKHRLARIFSRRVHWVQVLVFEGMTEEMGMDIVARELMLEFFNTCRFDDLVLDLDTDGVFEFLVRVLELIGQIALGQSPLRAILVVTKRRSHLFRNFIGTWPPSYLVGLGDP
ncbi:hypothetical protein Tco_0593375 [Tanacetum coccineum]